MTPEFLRYFESSTSHSNFTRNKSSLKFHWGDCDKITVADAVKMLTFFQDKRFDPFKSVKFNGPMCLDFFNAVERLDLVSKFSRTFHVHNLIVDKTVTLMYIQDRAEGVEDIPFLQKHTNIINTYSSTEKHFVVANNTGSTAAVALVIKELLACELGNKMWGALKERSACEYLDELMDNTLLGLKDLYLTSAVMIEAWKKVYEAARNTDLLNTYEVRRIAVLRASDADNIRTVGRSVGRADGWTDDRTDGPTDGRTDGRSDG